MLEIKYKPFRWYPLRDQTVDIYWGEGADELVKKVFFRYFVKTSLLLTSNYNIFLKKSTSLECQENTFPPHSHKSIQFLCDPILDTRYQRILVEFFKQFRSVLDFYFEELLIVARNRGHTWNKSDNVTNKPHNHVEVKQEQLDASYTTFSFDLELTFVWPWKWKYLICFICDHFVTWSGKY